MKIRNLSNRFAPSMLALGIVVSFAGMGTHSVLAQSVIATTPFPFCVNNHAYPKGSYRFTLLSHWILSIRDENGVGERFFRIYPEDGGGQGLVSGPMGSAAGVTFRSFQGFKELYAVHDPVSGLTFELIGQRLPGENLKTPGSAKPTNCFTEESSIRGRNTTGR
jgi:hypothetical protein